MASMNLSYLLSCPVNTCSSYALPAGSLKVHSAKKCVIERLFHIKLCNSKTSVKVKVAFLCPFHLFILVFTSRSTHCIGHITTGCFMGRGNQYIQLVKVLYYKLSINGKQLPAFPLEVGTGIVHQSERWEARVLPLCHRGPPMSLSMLGQA